MAKGDWVPCRNYGMSNTITVGDGIGITLLVRHGSTATPEAPEAVMETTDDLVVERVVGQINLTYGAEGEAVFVRAAARIVVGIYDDNSDAVAIYEDSLFGGGDANSPFLWQRYFYLTVAPGGMLEQYADPGWGAVDCRVNRRLTRGQCLLLLHQMSTTGEVTDSLELVPYLRSWVRTAG